MGRFYRTEVQSSNSSCYDERMSLMTELMVRGGSRRVQQATEKPASRVGERPPSPTRMARRWLGAGLAACMIGWGTNQFTPMLLLYRARLGLSPSVVEAMFAMYAVGLVPGLLAGGSLSDRIGRRRVVLFALVTSMIGGAVLIAGTGGAGWLFTGRLIVGLGSGSAVRARAAWVNEIAGPAS